MQGLDSADRALVEGVLARQLRPLAKTITLIESLREDHKERARHVLEALLPHTGGAVRVGISGVPGVGKSTFIEGLGLYLIEQGLRVAVLAVDPSSSVTGGSILGDKTRMEELSRRHTAFIRPSPAGASVGDLRALVARFIGDERAERAFAAWSAETDVRLRDTDPANASLARAAERMLAGAIGAASALAARGLELQG